MKAATVLSGGQEKQGSGIKLYISLKRAYTNFSERQSFPCSRFLENLLFKVFQGGKIKELFTIVLQPIWK